MRISDWSSDVCSSDLQSERDSIITAARFVADDSLEIKRGGKTRLTENRILLNATDLTARFDTGAARHTLVAGLELGKEKSTNLAPNGRALCRERVCTNV